MTSDGTGILSRVPAWSAWGQAVRRCGLLHGAEQLLAGLLAASAALGADSAVSHVLGMAAALVCAAPAHRHAGLDQWSRDVGVVLRLSGDDAAGGAADVGAIRAQADALGQVGRQAWLGQATVGAQRACAGTLDQRFDGPGEDA